MPFLHTLVLYGAGIAAIGTTGLVIFSNSPVYAVLYLVLSLFSVSLVLWSLGAVFLAVLEILVYAGAIMVLFLFVVMMLNVGTGARDKDSLRPGRKLLLLPGLFALFLAALTILAILSPVAHEGSFAVLGAKEIGYELFTRHFLGVKLASLILTIGMVGGMHLGRAASTTAEEQGHDSLSTYHDVESPEPVEVA